MKIQDMKSGLKRFLATGVLVASMPFVMGQGGCETVNLNDFSAITYGTLSNLERREGNYKKAEGYGALSRFSAIAGQREHDDNQREKDRQAMLEAARINAEAASEAARINAEAVRRAEAARVNAKTSNMPKMESIDNKADAEEDYRNIKLKDMKRIIGKDGTVILIHKDKIIGYIYKNPGNTE